MNSIFIQPQTFKHNIVEFNAKEISEGDKFQDYNMCMIHCISCFKMN